MLRLCVGYRSKRGQFPNIGEGKKISIPCKQYRPRMYKFTCFASDEVPQTPRQRWLSFWRLFLIKNNYPLQLASCFFFGVANLGTFETAQNRLYAVWFVRSWYRYLLYANHVSRTCMGKVPQVCPDIIRNEEEWRDSLWSIILFQSTWIFRATAWTFLLFNYVTKYAVFTRLWMTFQFVIYSYCGEKIEWPPIYPC